MLKEGYKKTEVGVIPEDWETNNVGECAKVTKLAGFEFTEYIEYIEDGEIIALRALNLKNGKLDLKDIKRIDRSVSENLQRSKLFNGNMLFSYVGTVGEVALIEENDKYHLAPNVAKLAFNENIIPKFALQYFRGNLIVNEINKYITTTSQPALSMENIRKLKIIIPPLKEQEKIAEILSTVDWHIYNTEKLIEKCRVLKKGLMQRLLTKGIGHSEFKKSEVGEIPVGWEVKKFSEISKVNQGLQIAIEDRFKEGSENRLPYITIQYINDKNNKDNEFFIENANESVICTEDDILMTRTGNTGEVVTNEHGVFHNNFFKIDYDRNFVVKDYLVYYLKSKEIQNLIRRYAGTTTIPDLKHSDFYRIPVVIPSIKEQEKIAGILLSVDNETEGYEREKQKLEELKKGLMQQLLTGKVRTI